MDFSVELLNNVRNKTPLVHFITNYVTVNDCANIALACGGSPIMADELKEVTEITSLANALVINIGTANERTLASMLRSGRHANNIGIPVVLDPAGVGASKFRNEAVQTLLREINFSVIKGNISEIKFLSDGIASTHGVDAVISDLVNEENLLKTLIFAKRLSVMTGSVIIITGAIDVVTDSATGFAVRNGHADMPSITGTGCMSGAVAGCFVGANPNNILEAVVASTAIMGICGELAHKKLLEMQNFGTSTYRNLIIDFMSISTAQMLEKYQKVEKLS